MKKIFFALAFVSMLLIISNETKAQNLSFRDFYSSLSPYGGWVNVGDYGMCWRPAGVPIGWRPYVDGHWIWTDYGWTWVSDYRWGWAPFHYGRWSFDPEYGWIWIPGYVWAPAWVEWRWGGGYMGWAPMPPGFHFRVDVVVGPDYHDFGVGIGGWNFIRAEEMGRPRYGYVERDAVPRVLGSTRNVTEYRFTGRGVYNTGLPRQQVEQATHRRIETVNIVRTNEVGRQRVEGGSFWIYSPAPFRPQIRNEQDVIQRERVRQGSELHQSTLPPGNDPPRPEMQPARVRTGAGSAYHPNRSAQSRRQPKQKTKPSGNDHGRERQSSGRDKDKGLGR